METHFSKRIYTFISLHKDIGFLLWNIPSIVRTMRDKKLGKNLVEKIMLVVTAVNGCTYCSWFHAKKATSSGMKEDEIQDMLNLQFQADAEKEELTALLYAQHYAETNRHPEAELTEKLNNEYGKKTAKHINMAIRMIYFGNLTGNTFDAFISRFKGKKAKNSNVIFEAVFFILNAPFLLPMLPFTKKYR